MHFQYKVNDPNDNAMYGGGGNYTNAPGSWDDATPGYLESGNLGSVSGNSILGTWTVKFTSDTARYPDRSERQQHQPCLSVL